MSLHVLNAGTGYLYYTSEIASGDELRAPGRELGDYYHAHGLPPGQWMGSGVDELGLKGNVTEEQMAHLYGEGIHPEAERIIAEKLALGWTQANAEKAAKLGRAYYKYQAKDTTLGALIRGREEAFKRLNHRPPTALERRNIRMTEAAILFRVEHGRNSVTKEELGRFITSQLRPQQDAVAGFDLTMTPVKSVSVLWAVGGPAARAVVEAVQDQAVKETLKFLEEYAVATRTGANGIAQEAVQHGVVASVFRHYDSRNGDPNIHDHAVLSTKVQDSKGHWKSIDSRLLHKMSVAASEFYNTRGQALMEERGFVYEARTTEGGKQPIMELAGIPAELNRLFSSRSEEMKPVLGQLVEDYEATHGHAPDTAALLKLAQAANLETRPDKGHGKSLEEHVALWMEQAHTVVDGAELSSLIDSIMEPVRSTHRTPREAAFVNVSGAAKEVIAAVSDKRSTWCEQHVMAETLRWSKAHAAKHGPVPTETVRAIMKAALNEASVSITPANPYSDFKPLQRDENHSVFEHRGSARFTSNTIIASENYLVRAGAREVIPAASEQDFLQAVENYNARVSAGEKHPLDAAQLALAREFSLSPHLISNGLGGAGTGKSTVMALVKDTIDIAGGKVIALAPSAVAAGILGNELGVEATTIDTFVLASGPDGRQALRVTPGTVVIIDEAAMAGTAKFTEAVRIIEAGGGVVRPVGDPYQHSAVQAGGAFSLLVNELGAVELDTVHRFRNADGTVNEAEAAASLALRTTVEGEENPFTWYQENGRIKAGDAETIEALAFTAWQQRINDGDPAVIMATTNDQARRLSEKAQAYQIHAGTVDTNGPGVQLRDGTTAWRGDTIVTRRNDRELTYWRGRESVRNGDLWAVLTPHDDGSITVAHQETGGTIRLPKEYVQEHTHLGYAYTDNRAQGMTRAYGIGIASSATSRNAAYVQLTRGQLSNLLFLELAPGETREEALSAIAANHGLEESVHAAIASEYVRMNDIDAMAAQYRHVDKLATELRMEHLVRSVLGEAAEEFISAESFGAVATHLANAEAQGWDTTTLLQAAYGEREFASAQDNSAVLAWRIQNIVQAAPALVEAKESRRPLAGLSDAQLATQLSVAEGRVSKAEAALTEVHTMHGPHPKNHWRTRSFGTLTDASLESRLATARREARTDTVILDPAKARKTAWEIRTLSNEIKIRAALPATQWAEETVARGTSTAGAARPDTGHKERLWQARTVAAALRDEARYRLTTPAHSAEDVKIVVGDRLPEWVAPARSLADPVLAEGWRTHLQERRTVLATRFNERGHNLAVEPEPWTEKLGPVPERADLNERWRDTAAEIAAFRALYKVPATETTPIPERFREQELGAALHTRAAETATSSHNATPATIEQLHAGAATATEKARNSHVLPSPAQKASEEERQSHIRPDPVHETPSTDRGGAGMSPGGTGLPPAPSGTVLAPAMPAFAPTIHLNAEAAPAAPATEAKPVETAPTRIEDSHQGRTDATTHPQPVAEASPAAPETRQDQTPTPAPDKGPGKEFTLKEWSSGFTLSDTMAPTSPKTTQENTMTQAHQDPTTVKQQTTERLQQQALAERAAQQRTARTQLREKNNMARNQELVQKKAAAAALARKQLLQREQQRAAQQRAAQQRQRENEGREL